MSILSVISEITGILSSVSVIVTVPIAILTFRRVILQRRSESLERVVEELRDTEFRRLAATVYRNFPVGSTRTAEARVPVLLDRMIAVPDEAERKAIVRDAVELVNRLNNIGAMIEQGAVREKDLHGQTHPRVIELAARLDPFILVRSAKLGYRWGMRVRRLSRGAKSYYRTSRLHNRRPLQRDGVTLVDETSGWRWLLSHENVRACFGRYMPRAQSTRAIDERDVESVRRLIEEYPAETLGFLDP